MKTLTLAQAIEGFLLDLAARRLSPHTIADYTNALRKLQAFLGGDPLLAAITADDLRRFMTDLETLPASPPASPSVPPGRYPRNSASTSTPASAPSTPGPCARATLKPTSCG